MSLEEKKPTLYSFYRSSCSWRVRASLNWKEIDYDIIPVNLVKEEHKSIEYTNLNPLQEVPTFISNDGKVLTQSIAILEYLEEVYPQKPLLPSNPYEKSLVRSLVQAIASDTQPLQNLRVLNYVGKDKRLEWAEHWITINFQGIERQLSSTSKDYCVGNKVTLADICLVPQVYNANSRYNVDMTKFPTIQKIVNNLNKLDEFIKSHPNNQVDCPEDMKSK